MLGTWRWNAVFGLFGACLTIIFSIGSNPFSVILLRSGYALIVFFLLAYGMRAALAIVLRPPAIAPVPEMQQDNTGNAGTQLDITTPDETGDLNDLLKKQLQGVPAAAAAAEQSKAAPADSSAAFRPLNPPQLVSTANKQPEEMAKALRHLTGE